MSVLCQSLPINFPCIHYIFQFSQFGRVVRKIKVLVVDDEQHYIDELRSILAPLPLFDNVIGFTDSISALLQLEKIKPDLLITDILMSGMNGLELAQKVKCNHPAVKILFMEENIEYAVNAFDLGVDGFLSKPLSNEQVCETLYRIWKPSP